MVLLFTVSQDYNEGKMEIFTFDVMCTCRIRRRGARGWAGLGWAVVFDGGWWFYSRSDCDLS